MTKVTSYEFPAIARNNSDIHYSNGIASEFLGSSIFNILGLPAQKTYLGCYERPDGKRYEVVACKDFNEMGKYTFHDFGSLKNSVISSPSDGYGTELTSVVDAIENQLYVEYSHEIAPLVANSAPPILTDEHHLIA